MSVKVSVGIITYNHEKYIADAIEGALCQKLDQEYEIVIGDDCSTDGTGRIVAQYADKYPDKIRVVPHESNLGPRKNFESIIHACRGEYIANLDGDDYWTDPNKLQRQSDCLDENPTLSACFHSTQYIYNDGAQQNVFPPGRKEVYGIEDILSENCISSNTLMFRSTSFRDFPKWMHENNDFPGDLYILYSCLQQGNIGYIDNCMAAYRVHDGGIWSSLSELQKIKSELSMNRYLQGLLGDQYRSVLFRRSLRLRTSLWLKFLTQYLEKNQYLCAIKKAVAR